MSAPPSSLPNLGPVVDAWLREIGVETADELRALGAVEAFLRLRFTIGKRVSAVALYALDGALTGTDWRRIDPERKAQLRREAGLR